MKGSEAKGCLLATACKAVIYTSVYNFSQRSFNAHCPTYNFRYCITN